MCSLSFVLCLCFTLLLLHNIVTSLCFAKYQTHKLSDASHAFSCEALTGIASHRSAPRNRGADIIHSRWRRKKFTNWPHRVHLASSKGWRRCSFRGMQMIATFSTLFTSSGRQQVTCPTFSSETNPNHPFSSLQLIPPRNQLNWDRFQGIT